MTLKQGSGGATACFYLDFFSCSDRMARNLSEESVQKLVRDKLNRESVKLWLPPYTVRENADQPGTYPEGFVSRYSQELVLPEGVVFSTMERLRVHALSKLAAKQRFLQKGIAVLKLKLVGKVCENITDKTVDLECSLEFTGEALKKLISLRFDIDHCYLKLISCARVVNDSQNLREQHISHLSQVMVIFLSESEADIQRKEKQKSNLDKTKEAAKLLANRKENADNDYYLQISDQSGHPLKLPDHEREALTLALTLNEKGRATMKRKQYAEALLLLLEADEEFKQCRSEILGAVDNYAVLCLDIVWCYLSLQNINNLHDAETRLKTCEECFVRSYGANMERLLAIKGDSSGQKALYVRLYLMQGILAYYQNRKSSALTLLAKAETTLKSLQVDDSKLSQIVAMGFTPSEGRLGLRASQGHVELAAVKIMDRREERKEQAKKEAEEMEKKKLGKTANGEWVSLDQLQRMVSMGYPRASAVAALKQTNNNLTKAVQALHDHPELLTLPDLNPPAHRVTITEQMLAQITSLGFDEENARRGLNRHFGDVQKAVDELLAQGGVLPQDSSASAAGSSSSRESASGSSRLSEEERNAIGEIVPDIPEHEEDYLDLTLEEEAHFIEEYKILLTLI